MNKKALAVFTAIYALLCSSHLFWGLDLGNPQHVITKALPIAALIIASLVSASGKWRLVFALFFSLAGDISSELNLEGNLPALLQIVFFAVAQLFYILEFASYIPVRRRDRALVVLPGLTAVYGLLVAGMVISSCLQRREDKAFYICGAFLFLFSDGMILASRLGASIPHTGFLIMISYYAAQYLLNISTLRFPRG